MRNGFKALAVVAVTTVLMASAPPSGPQPLTKAQSDKLAAQAQICGTGEVSDQTIAACSVVIGSGRYSGDALATYYFDRGLSYAKSQRYAYAIADFDQAIAIKPNFARAYFVRGTVKQVSGDQAGGDADIAKARELDPTVGM